VEPVPVTVGQALVLRLDVTNAGPNPAAAVRLSLTLPSQARLQQVDAGEAEVESTAETVRIQFGDMAANGVAQATIKLVPQLPLPITNRVTVSSHAAEANPEDNVLTLVTPVARPLGPGVPRVLPLKARALAFNPVDGRLYATVPGANTNRPGGVLAIEPSTGVISGQEPLGLEPTELAISPDGRFLFALLAGEGEVARLDLLTHAVLRFSGGTDEFGQRPIVAFDIDATNSDAIFAAIGGWHAGTYHVTLNGPQGRPVLVSGPLITARDRSRAFLYSVNSFPQEMWVLEPGPEGLVTVRKASLGGPLTWCDGRLLAQGGNGVWDASTLRPVGFANSAGLMTGDAASGRLFVLSRPGGGSSTATVRGFDWETVAPVGSEQIPFVLGAPHHLVRWGERGLAFLTDTGECFVTETRLVPSEEPADLSLHFTAATESRIGNLFSWTLLVRNEGPNDADNVVVGVHLPERLNSISVEPDASAAVGDETRPLSWTVGHLPVGESAQLVFRAVKYAAGDLDFEAHVTSNGRDPQLANNFARHRTQVVVEPTPNTATRLDLVAADAAYDARRDRLYVARWDAPVAALAPQTGTGLEELPGGIEGVRLAVSDNGESLYVLAPDWRTVHRLELSTGNSDLKFSLPNDAYVEEMLSVPGRANAVVFSTFDPNDVYYHCEVSLYVDGVKQPKSGTGFTGPAGISFAGPGELFGIERVAGSPSGPAVQRLLVGDDGILPANDPNARLTALASGVRVIAGRLFSNAGEAVDLATGQNLGPLAFGGLDWFNTRLGDDPFLKQLLVLRESSTSAAALSAFSASSLKSLGVVPLPSGATGCNRIVRCGADRVALPCHEGLILVRLNSLPAADLELALSTDRQDVLAGAEFALTVTMRNLGPWTAQNARLQVTAPVHVERAQGSAGAVEVTEGLVRLVVPALAGGAAARLDLVCRSTNTSDAMLTIASAATCDLPDPFPVSNSRAATLRALADNDRDSLPDWWETAFNLDPADPLDTRVDSDGDGASNGDEFLAGTSPRDPADSLRLVASFRDGGGVRLQFSTHPDRQYRLEFRYRLDAGTWFPVTEPIIGDGHEMEREFGTPPGGWGYWRLVVKTLKDLLPPPDGRRQIPHGRHADFSGQISRFTRGLPSASIRNRRWPGTGMKQSENVTRPSSAKVSMEDRSIKSRSRTGPRCPGKEASRLRTMSFFPAETQRIGKPRTSNVKSVSGISRLRSAVSDAKFSRSRGVSGAFRRRTGLGS
jgi:DNA-binding beta-propeller fold protein YncE